MSDNTGIEWTDATWNPIRGCSRVSEGCKNCYAETVAHRFSGPGLTYEGLTHRRTGAWNGTIRVVEEVMTQPLRWRRPRRIFVNSMSDLFHENVPPGAPFTAAETVIDEIFAVMALAPQHTFQVLTKRAARMLAYLEDERTPGRVADCAQGFLAVPRPGVRPLQARWWPLPNVWLGVSVENQAAADERIPLLLRTPAAVRFLSCEPLLGPIDLEHVRHSLVGDSFEIASVLRGHDDFGLSEIIRHAIDWVIVGGESGKNARPMHPHWAFALRDQCVAAGVPFFFKQWGEFIPRVYVGQGGERCVKLAERREPIVFAKPDEKLDPDRASSAVNMVRVGKRVAGRVLTDRTWDEFPVAP